MHTGVTLDPIAVGTARKEELLLAEGLDAWEMKPRSDAMRHMERASYGTWWLLLNKGDTSKPEYRSRHVVDQDAHNINNSQRQRGRTQPCGSGQAFLALQCRCLAMVLQWLDVWRAHAHCKVLRGNVCIGSSEGKVGLDTSQ